MNTFKVLCLKLKWLSENTGAVALGQYKFNFEYLEHYKHLNGYLNDKSKSELLPTAGNTGETEIWQRISPMSIPETLKIDSHRNTTSFVGSVV